MAKKEGKHREDVQSLAKTFFNLMRQQSALKKKSGQASETRCTKATRQQCHKHFWT